MVFEALIVMRHSVKVEKTGQYRPYTPNIALWYNGLLRIALTDKNLVRF
jgi:hypothetical protein